MVVVTLVHLTPDWYLTYPRDKHLMFLTCYLCFENGFDRVVIVIHLIKYAPFVTKCYEKISGSLYSLDNVMVMELC